MGEGLSIGGDEEAMPDFSPTPQISEGDEPKNEPETHSDRIIVDHEEMLKKQGPHLHNQTVTPAPATVDNNYHKPEPSPQTAPPFKSIVDQKLAGLVHSVSAPPDAPTNVSPSGGYKGPDPYREPIE
ncbi:MAG: hypothetical protein AAB635_00735, partial [Patescibacteria group bacterium]